MKRSGLTLVETILALSLLSVLLILLLNLFPTSLRAVRQSEQRLLATGLARSLLEEQTARPFASLTPGPLPALPERTLEKTSFQPALEIFQPPDSDPRYLRGIRATVSWLEGGRDNEVVQEVWVSSVRQ